MKITVFGASGKVGRQVVAKLLEQGHQVAAFVHHASLPANDNLTVVTGDVHDASAVSQAIQGSQVVISALGSWGTPTKDIVSSAMRAIVPAMQQQGIKRLISLTGSGALAPSDKPKLFDKLTRAGMKLVAGKIMTDSEDHLAILANSDLDWTVIRSPVMTNSGSTKYRLNLMAPLPWKTIPRSAVAQAIVDQVDATDHLGAAPHIHRA